MFQGSKNVGSDKHFEILRKIGIERGQRHDEHRPHELLRSRARRTSSRPRCGSRAIAWAICSSSLDRSALDNQIDVVRNERRQNYDNVPYRKALFALYAAMYPEGHPYRYLTIGKHEDLTAASLDDVKSFFKTWYVPSNATIAIVGDFDVADDQEARREVVRRVPGEQEAADASRCRHRRRSATTVTVEDSFAKQRQVTFAWHSPANFADGDAELDIAANALGAEGRGRLYKALVYDKQLATRVSVGQDGSRFSGTFDVTVTLRTERGPRRGQEDRHRRGRAASRRRTSPTRRSQRVVAAQRGERDLSARELNARANVLQALQPLPRRSRQADVGSRSLSQDDTPTRSARPSRSTSMPATHGHRHHATPTGGAK